MEPFITTILILTQISVVVTTIQVYLRVNKIWKRKHEKEVAESQSIAGILLLIGNCILWIFYYIWVETDTLSIVDTSLYLVESFVFLLISTGLWVKGKKTRNLWKLMLSALRLERKESTYLLKKVFKPTNAATIINILHQIAMIDEELDPKEQKLIQAFADEWNIDYSIDELNKDRKTGDSYNFIMLRESMIEYLSTEPPKEQAAQLQDMIETLVEIDEKITEEEELIQIELLGLLRNYIAKEELDLTKFYVIIVPQSSEHHKVIESIIPTAQKLEISGGVAYSIGSYFSRQYAEIICDQYREINLFTIVHTFSNNENIQDENQ